MHAEIAKPFIFSSALDNPQRLFDGFCFAGRDYVCGHDGAEKYEKATGAWVSGLEDGCYASITRHNDGFRVCPDFWGYKKIYYIHRGDFWAFSNSLQLILEHLQSAGIALLPNRPLMQSILLRDVMFEQVFSFDLIAEGLHLLPAGHDLRIGKSGAKVTRVRQRRATGSYRDLLSLALETWVCRIETLLTSGSVVPVAALTGGLDSRTVFSLLQRARLRCGLDPSAFHLTCGSIKGDATDLQVATDICRRLDLSLNRGHGKNAAVLTGDQSVDTYMNHCAGVYHPMYFPAHAMHPLDVFFGGSGGENHRPFYTVDSPAIRLKFWQPHDPWQRFVDSLCSRISNSSSASAISGYLHAGMKHLRTFESEDQNPLRLHYQHFRNRFHAGRSMQNRVDFAPLSSFLMHDAARCLSEDRLNEAQLHYDIMASLMPSLLEIPFDKAWKTPSSNVVARLTRAEIRPVSNPGRMFVSDVPQAGPRAGATSSYLALLGRLQNALDRDLPQAVLGPDVIAHARTSVETAVASGRFFHATDGISTAAVLAAGLFR